MMKLSRKESIAVAIALFVVFLFIIPTFLFFWMGWGIGSDANDIAVQGEYNEEAL